MTYVSGLYTYFEKRNIIEMHGNGQKNRVYMIEDGQLVMIKKDLTDKIERQSIHI